MKGFINLRTTAVVVAFLVAVAWFFVPVGKPEGDSLLFALRLALPAALLAVGGIGLLPWLMTAGFLFCCVGDAMGVMGSFEGQMGGFAVAHVCFICWLAKGVSKSTGRRVVGSKSHKSAILIIILLCLAALALAAVRIIPKVDDVLIRIGCAVYALLLTGTFGTAWIRMVHPAAEHPTGRRLLTALGATSFLVSDFVLAWNKFVCHVPNSRLLIMSTYYAALLLLFIGEATKNKKKSHF